MNNNETPKIGTRFTHVDGGLYEVYSVNQTSQYAIWYKPALQRGVHHRAVPGTTATCTLENWPIVSGQLLAAPEICLCGAPEPCGFSEISCDRCGTSAPELRVKAEEHGIADPVCCE